MANTGRTQRRIRLTAGALVGVVVVMVGMSFAAVPLYRLICQATGIGGTPKTEGITRATEISDRTLVVRFDANVNPALPWRFEPAQASIEVRLGEEALVLYRARNLGAERVVGTATFNVVPETTARYFNKIACFCFSEQVLNPGQEVDMPVVFFIDPAIAEDPEVADVKEITLSYTFFRAPGSASAKGVLGLRNEGAAARGG